MFFLIQVLAFIFTIYSLYNKYLFVYRSIQLLFFFFIFIFFYNECYSYCCCFITIVNVIHLFVYLVAV